MARKYPLTALTTDIAQFLSTDAPWAAERSALAVAKTIILRDYEIKRNFKNNIPEYTRRKETAKRMFRLRFSYKNKKYEKSRKYYLVAYDDKNDLEILRHEIIMDIAFADDFGFNL